VSLLSVVETAGIDPTNGEPFYWRGWSDAVRCIDGRHYHLRDAAGTNFEGYPVGMVCGRERAPFKLIPRYVDLSLYRTSLGTYVCHRKWVSEAHGEPPVVYSTIEAPTLEDMRDKLLNYDPSALAMTLWPEDVPEYARRSKRAKQWLRSCYANRVALLLANAVNRE
jgi:hypothetical protein